MAGKPLTLIIGASTNPARYSYLAAHRLVAHGIPIACIGLKMGHVAGNPILTGFPAFDKVHTVTLYINPARQPAYYNYIAGLQPQRVIFNPGTENDKLATLLQQQGIEVMEACTLVMLATGQY